MKYKANFMHRFFISAISTLTFNLIVIRGHLHVLLLRGVVFRAAIPDIRFKSTASIQ